MGTYASDSTLCMRTHVTYALRAPPPFACPSSLVTMTEATSTFSLKALACDSHAWPIVASITNTMLSGCCEGEREEGGREGGKEGEREEGGREERAEGGRKQVRELST